MIVIPAIDLKEGNCVRLEQGEMHRDTVFSNNPAEQALIWQSAGAELLHLVDLDGAFAGIPKNKTAIESIIAAITIPAQLGGGIRDIATIEAYLSLGLSRVIIGTAAQRVIRSWWWRPVKSSPAGLWWELMPKTAWWRYRAGRK